MVNRGNWKAVKSYLRHRKDIGLLAPESIRLEETWLRYLLEWSEETSFNNSEKLRPAYMAHLLNLKSSRSLKPLSHEYLRKVISSARRFLIWLQKHDRSYRSIPFTWLESLKLPRPVRPASVHEYVTLDEINAIASAPTYSLVHKRVQAAAVFLFLSGMRVGAFTTLPLEAVNIRDFTVLQWPSLGVKTKIQKTATTYLLDIPVLSIVASKWDEVVREVLPKHGYWFAPISPETGEINPDFREVGVHRQAKLRKDLKEWLARVDLPYHSPHKLRHGHAVYALKQARDMADHKAVSQNLMHSNISVTDGIYGILSADDTRKRIANLGKTDLHLE